MEGKEGSINGSQTAAKMEGGREVKDAGNQRLAGANAGTAQT